MLFSENLKLGTMAHKEIFELISNNLSGLNSINISIDQDIRKELLNFNPEYNEELRNILCQQNACMPLRENKFSNLLTSFIRDKDIQMKKAEDLFSEGIFIYHSFFY